MKRKPIIHDDRAYTLIDKVKVKKAKKPESIKNRHEKKIIITISSFNKSLLNHYHQRLNDFIEKHHRIQTDIKTTKKNFVWIDSVGEN